MSEEYTNQIAEEYNNLVDKYNQALENNDYTTESACAFMLNALYHAILKSTRKDEIIGKLNLIDER